MLFLDSSLFRDLVHLLRYGIFRIKEGIDPFQVRCHDGDDPVNSHNKYSVWCFLESEEKKKVTVCFMCFAEVSKLGAWIHHVHMHSHTRALSTSCTEAGHVWDRSSMI